MGDAAGELTDGVHLLQMRGLALRSFQRRGRFLLHRDVAAGDIDQAVILGQGPLQPAPRTVFVAKAIFHAYGLHAPRQLRAAGDGVLRVVGMAQIVYMHGLDLVLGPAEQSGPGRVQADEIALEIGDREQIFRDVPDAVALQRAPFDLELQFFA